MTTVFKPAVVIEELGEMGRLPDGGHINAGGVAGPNFTVGGKALIFADGTASDGSGQVISVGTSVTGWEHKQLIASMVWTITHNRNTERIQATIWDDTNEMVWSDTVKIIDPNVVQIKFNTPLTGRAILMMF